jgi:hypothetical protein
VVSTDKPVFSDDSGRRAAVLKWSVGAICILAVLFGGAMVLTLGTHVSLPGVDQLPPPPLGQLGGDAAMPTTQESPSQAPQPSIVFQQSPTPTSAPSATKPSARPTATVKRAAPTATRTSRPSATAQATARTSTTKDRNPKAATPSPRGSRPTSKPGNGPG